MDISIYSIPHSLRYNNKLTGPVTSYVMEALMNFGTVLTPLRKYIYLLQAYTLLVNYRSFDLRNLLNLLYSYMKFKPLSPMWLLNIPPVLTIEILQLSSHY